MIKQKWRLLDFLNKVELPIVRGFQTIFFAEKLSDFHIVFDYSTISKFIGAFPMVYECSNEHALAKQIAIFVLVHIFFSSLSRELLARRRPLMFKGVYNPLNKVVKYSSFPSCGAIAAAIFVPSIPFIPNPEIYIAINVVLLISPVILGFNFPTDVIFGYLIGMLARDIGMNITSQYVYLPLLLACYHFWPDCATLLGMIFPYFYLPEHQEIWMPLSAAVILYFPDICKDVKYLIQPQNKFEMFISGVIPTIIYYLFMHVFSSLTDIPNLINIKI